MTAVLPYDLVTLSEGGTIPGRYDDIDLTATRQMERAAARGKELRQKHRRGGTRKGLNMANRILSGDRIHPDNVRDMFAFFSRFAEEAQRQRGTERWDPTSDRVGPLRIAWDLWGGDGGRAWSRRKRDQLDRADREETRRTHEAVGPVLRAVDIQATLPRPDGWGPYSAPRSDRSAPSGGEAGPASSPIRSSDTTTGSAVCSKAPVRSAET